MDDQLEGFKTEIKQIALFAKEIDFDIENGDMGQLVKKWIKREKHFYNEENREQVIKTVKQFIK